MEDLNFTISFIVGFGYLFYFQLWKPSDLPQNRRYIRLFDKKYFHLQLLISTTLAVIGYYRAVNFDGREIFYLSPLVFLLTFQLLNKISTANNGKNIVIALGQDNLEQGNRFYPRLNFFVLTFTSILIPGLIMNYINIGRII